MVFFRLANYVRHLGSSLSRPVRVFFFCTRIFSEGRGNADFAKRKMTMLQAGNLETVHFNLFSMCTNYRPSAFL